MFFRPLKASIIRVCQASRTVSGLTTGTRLIWEQLTLTLDRKASMVQPFCLSTHVEQVLDEFTDWPCCNDFVQRNRYAYTQIELKHRNFFWDFVDFITFVQNHN